MDGDLERLTELHEAVGAALVGMARLLLPDDLWIEIGLLLPPPRPRPKGERPPIDNLTALIGILFVSRAGLPWEMLPAEMGCGCGMSC